MGLTVCRNDPLVGEWSLVDECHRIYQGIIWKKIGVNDFVQISTKIEQSYVKDIQATCNKCMFFYLQLKFCTVALNSSVVLTRGLHAKVWFYPAFAVIYEPRPLFRPLSKTPISGWEKLWSGALTLFGHKIHSKVRTILFKWLNVVTRGAEVLFTKSDHLQTRCVKGVNNAKFAARKRSAWRVITFRHFLDLLKK